MHYGYLYATQPLIMQDIVRYQMLIAGATSTPSRFFDIDTEIGEVFLRRSLLGELDSHFVVSTVSINTMNIYILLYYNT